MLLPETPFPSSPGERYPACQTNLQCLWLLVTIADREATLCPGKNKLQVQLLRFGLSHCRPVPQVGGGSPVCGHQVLESHETSTGKASAKLSPAPVSLLFLLWLLMRWSLAGRGHHSHVDLPWWNISHLLCYQRTLGCVLLRGWTCQQPCGFDDLEKKLF